MIIDDPTSIVGIIFAILCVYVSVRNRHNLTKSALPSVSASAWAALFNFGDDASFLELTGFDRASFYELHDIIFFGEERQSTGRPKKLDSYSELGLLLHYLNSTMRLKSLAQIFGAVPCIIGRSIDKMLVLTIQKLERHPKASVRWPTDEAEIEDLSQRSATRIPYGLFQKIIIGFLDGLSLLVSAILTLQY